MRPSPTALIGLAATLAACGDPRSPSFPSFTTDTYGAPLGPVVYATEPSVLPTTLAVGERVSVRIVVAAAPADHHAEFLSQSPHVRWIIPDPPCSRNFCADLLAVSPSEPTEEVCVTILICPPGFTAYCPSGPDHCLKVVPA